MAGNGIRKSATPCRRKRSALTAADLGTVTVGAGEARILCVEKQRQQGRKSRPAD